ncbi:MAG TPA: hypothetical protein PL056_13880 [bacterium]|nr:hypothetical protein [bacterium]
MNGSNNSIRIISDIGNVCEKFKIGKTGQTLEERFQGEYQQEYDNIVEVYRNKKKEIVDFMEMFLIDHFMKSKEYSDKLQNEQVGGGEMADFDEYYVYVVYKL